MEPRRRAVIDVGTNSVKLLVADVAGREVIPIWEESNQTRLGRGFYEARRLQTPAIGATARAVREYAARARERGATSVRVIATSAAREASNAQELTSALESASGLKVEIISGEQEADFAFQGATTDPELEGASLVLLDVGGGSMQFILGRNGRKLFGQSFPLGTVRLLESQPPSDPPKPGELAACRKKVREFLGKEVAPKLEEVWTVRIVEPDTSGAPFDREQGGRLAEAVRLVGTGGTASILGCMEARLERFDRARLEATRLSLGRVCWHVEYLWHLPLEERKQVTGLPKNRADVILMGVAIYEGVMEQLGFTELRISTRGLRFAAVMDAGG